MRGKLLVGMLITLAGVAGVMVGNRHDSQQAEVSLGFPSPRNLNSVTIVPRGEIQKISRQIDLLAGTNTTTKVSDATFVRRVYLDIAGRIPTLKETTRFLSSQAKNKRASLVDQLLDSPAYVSHQFNFWADLLRIQSRNRIGPDLPYIDFVKDSIADNKPYDQFVYELLTASGPLMKRGNGAVGYLMRDYGMPEDNMSNTVRIFLGARLECAQCHDHPDGDWTQRQYFEMFAFNGGVHPYLMKTDSEFDLEIQAMISDPDLTVQMQAAIRQIAVPLHYGINGGGMGLARLPENYRYSDGAQYEVIPAKLILGGSSIDTVVPEKGSVPAEGMYAQQQLHHVRGAKHVDSRKQLADWLTSENNENFSTVIANRLWKQAMGDGLIEPVDDIREDTVASNPELMTFLARSVVELNFDTKQLLRAIYLTDTYQQDSVRIAELHDEATEKMAPIFRRMSAEQIWDSLLTLTVEGVEHIPSTDSPEVNYLGLDNIYETYDRLVTLTPAEIKDLALDNLEPNGPGSYPRKHVFRIDARPAIFRQDEIYNNLSGDELYRASELMSPMPPNHLLREMGQSDREQVDNGNKDIALSQLMSLMNGFVERRIVKNSDSALMKELARAKNVPAKIESAYLSILGRKPTGSEREIWAEDFADFGDETVGDMVWSLTNSTEFLFIR